jgi:hypothetical protein
MKTRTILRVKRAQQLQVAGVVTFKRTDGTPTRTVSLAQYKPLIELWRSGEFMAEVDPVFIH